METAALLVVTAAAVPFPSSRDPWAQGCIKRPHWKYNQRQCIVRVSRPGTPMEVKIRVQLPTCSVSGPVSKAHEKKVVGSQGHPATLCTRSWPGTKNAEPSLVKTSIAASFSGRAIRTRCKLDLLKLRGSLFALTHK